MPDGGLLELAVIEGASGVAGGGGAAGGGIFAGVGLFGAGSVSLGSLAFSIGASIGLSYAARLLQQDQGAPLQNPTQTIRQAVPPRFIDVGRGRTAGALVGDWTPTAANLLYTAKVMSCTRIAAIEKYFFNEVDSTTDGSPLTVGGAFVTNGPWALDTLVRIEAGLGGPGQLAPDTLVDIVDGWTTDYRLSGLAYGVVRYTPPTDQATFIKAYPNGAPDFSFVIQGAMVPDPRLGQSLTTQDDWTYNDNAACVLLRYLVDIDGAGFDPADLVVESFGAGADICDDVVPITIGTEARYRIWGRYTTAEARKTVIADMLATCAGRLIEQADGRIKLFAGKRPDPDDLVTIRSEHVIIDQPLRVDRFGDSLDAATVFAPRINWEAANWQEQPAPPYSIPNPVIGVAPVVQDMALRFCPSPYQAQRLAKQMARALNPEYRASFATKLFGMTAFGERWINLAVPELGLAGVFELTAPPKLDIATMTVAMAVRSVAADEFEMLAGEMSDMPPVPVQPVPNTDPGGGGG